MMSKKNIASGLFESINARFLRPEEVAKSFVICDHFKNLSVRGHSLAVGPRGSGKTTLLKMLQGQALSAWAHSESAYYRNRINYTGVFIPTDIVWAKQIYNLGGGYLNPEQHKLVLKAIFTTHILHELIQAMLYRLITPNDKRPYVHGGVKSNEVQETELVKALSEILMIETEIYSLISLKQSLIRRMGEIYEIVSKEMFLNSEGRNERFANIEYFHTNFLQATLAAIEVFGDIYGNKDERWALLFDELELAPKEIVEYLINSLRSTNQKLFFKLSFSPYNENVEILEEAWAAMPGHDFQYIRLWYPNKEDGLEFSIALFSSMLKEKGVETKNVNNILGYSYLENRKGNNRPQGKYNKSSPNVQILKRLYKSDRSFRNYVFDNKIDLDGLDQLTEEERARWARKILPIAIVRDAFRKPDSHAAPSGFNKKAKFKSRKAYPIIYSGTKSMLEMLEGNPRWIIGVIAPLLDIHIKANKMVDKSKQMAEINRATNQFKSLLSAMPCDVSPVGEPPKSVLAILNMIGGYFKKVVVENKFKPEPYGSFWVDESTTIEFEKALALALNAGAIVYIPGAASNLIIKSLKGHRFRLSYLLAPHYQIPIQLMRATSLKNILRGQESSQLQLFDE